MATAILDSEGRLTLLPEILERLHLKPGDSVRVEANAPANTLSVEGLNRVASSVPAPRPPTLTPEESAKVLNDRGAWADVNGAEYVDALRKEWDERLAELWGENDTP